MLQQPLPAPQDGLHDQVRQFLVLRDRLMQSLHRDRQHRPGLPDHRGSEQPLSGQDVELGQEPTRAEGGQFPHHPGLVVNHRDSPRQHHDELVGPVSLTKQHLPGSCRPFLPTAAQQRQMRSLQRGGEVRICARIPHRHPNAPVIASLKALPPIKRLSPTLPS